MHYYKDFACPFERNLQTSYFLVAHTWCFFSKMISYALERCKHYEWADLFRISYVPLYIGVIFEAHFYELNSMIKDSAKCEDGSINLLFQWYIIELRVFYGYILAGVLFIVMCQLFGVDKTRRQVPNDALTGAQGDFLEKYQ